MNSDAGKPPRNWTTARLESLTASQVKALLVVASGSRAAAQSSPRNADEEDRLLADMSRAHGGANDRLLDKASTEATPVDELIRIKNLAKTLINEAGDSRQRDVARLLYHVAVAAAFVHHAAAISGRPIEKQRLLYERFAAAWAGHAIGRVFGEAAARAPAPVPPE
jgi:hypothetical protein